MSKEIELPSDLVDALNKYIDVWSKTGKCPTLGASMFRCPRGWLPRLHQVLVRAVC